MLPGCRITYRQKEFWSGHREQTSKIEEDPLQNQPTISKWYGQIWWQLLRAAKIGYFSRRRMSSSGRDRADLWWWWWWMHMQPSYHDLVCWQCVPFNTLNSMRFYTILLLLYVADRSSPIVWSFITTCWTNEKSTAWFSSS